LSDEEKIKELIERIQRLSVKEKEVEARMKKLEMSLPRKKKTV
jgi:hypothetical protein